MPLPPAPTQRASRLTHTAFESARQLLLQLRGRQTEAAERFRWPQLTTFNWALDHFDALALGADGGATALWIVEADGSIRVVPVDPSPVKAFRGMGRVGSSTLRLLADREADRAIGE